MTENKPIWLDMDGVLCAYDSEYKRLTGGDPGEKGKLKALRFKDHPHFYRNLPWEIGGQQLWNAVKQYHPSILSAQSNFLKSSRQDKIEWCEEHLGLSGPRVIIVNYPNEKVKHCTPGSILIDDNAKNCEEWERAGGKAILHTSAEDTLKRLHSLLNHVETTNVTETITRLSESEPEVAVPNIVSAFEELTEDRT